MRMKLLAASIALALTVAPAAFADRDHGHHHGGHHHGHQQGPEMFRHVATFDVTRNRVMHDGEEIVSEVAEIVDATPDGNTLVYTDAASGLIGFVDITDPADPQPDGGILVGGEPTSVAVHGRYALAAVNTSTVDEVTCTDPGDDGVFGTGDDESEDIGFITQWTGKLVVIDVTTRSIVREIELGGQPDSVAVSPDGRYAAIVIESERNEDVGDGLIPQGRETVDLDPTPDCDLVSQGDPEPGRLVILDLKGKPGKWSTRDVQLAGLAGMYAAQDPEPEFVDINGANMATITLQENNHIAVVNLRTGKVVKHFSAGEVDLMNVDTEEEDLINLDSDITKRREPDAITWIGDSLMATANEGDYEDENGEEGGSRGFTVFNKAGKVVFESYEAFEHLIVSIGQYNEGRSENKGVEPEGIEYARFGNDKLLFVGSERSNVVGVYEMNGAKPELLQVLPTGIGPEGLRAVPQRKLFVASTETDVFDAGIPTMINIFQRGHWPSNYPQIASADDANGLPIPWAALSDLVGDPDDAHTLYAVSDSFLAKGFIYTVDVSAKPALITDRLEVQSDDALDLEGVAVGPDGNFWLGSEGNAGSVDNLVLKVDRSSGAVLEKIELPADLVDRRRSNGIEGVAVTGEAGSEMVYVVIQRAWPNEGDTDKVNTKIGRYDVAAGTWSFVHYPLEAEGDGDWIGLSGITAMPNGRFWVIERDKGWGPSTPPNAELKAIFEVDLASAEFRPYVQPLPGEEADLVTLDKTLIRNLVSDIAANSIWTAEKLEGFAVSADERLYAVTDNDGVDDSPGETVFLDLGDLATFGSD
ncbi:MAG: esterase-like activity of phytase family protein [Chromatiaceae bacterium]|nr:esterase-like activity of phytase family protein [Chromatiaceae bacterium]